MLGYIVQQEAGGYGLQHKQAIVQVVLNRVRSEDFPDTIYGVLTQANQFSSLSNWYSRRNPPDAVTLEAVESVLGGEYIDVTNGATFFYAPRWAEALRAGLKAACNISLPLTATVFSRRRNRQAPGCGFCRSRGLYVFIVCCNRSC